MVKVVALLVPLALLAACGKSTCEKYADMEWKCGNYPASEKDITKALAQGMCEAAESQNAELKDMGDHFKKEAACAAKFTDCAQYKACTDAVEPIKLDK
jgi:hypothetical protein